MESSKMESDQFTDSEYGYALGARFVTLINDIYDMPSNSVHRMKDVLFASLNDERREPRLRENKVIADVYNAVITLAESN